MLKFLKLEKVTLSSLVAISKCDCAFTEVSPSKLDAWSSNNPATLSKSLSLSSVVCVILAVSLVVCIDPKSIIFAKS